MKKVQILRVICLGAGMFALHAQGALLGIDWNPNDDQYAAFNSGGLQINYSYNAGTGIGTFTAVSSSSPSSSMAYTSSIDSPGTHGLFNATPFTGYYSLDAQIENYGGVWGVSSGSVTVEGALSGVTTSASDVLLTANLETGPRTFGYGDGGGSEFDFLFTPTGGNQSILADFSRGLLVPGGAIIMDAGPSDTYAGSFTQSFGNDGDGSAITFVPEAPSYLWAAAAAAVCGFLFATRKRGWALEM